MYAIIKTTHIIHLTQISVIPAVTVTSNLYYTPWRPDYISSQQ